MFERTTLSNGLRILTAPIPNIRSATVTFYVGAGSRYESIHEAGVSHFLEHMVFKGSARYPTAKRIAEAIESHGGNHNAATDRELTLYYAKVPDQALVPTLDILSDMMIAPIMNPDEFEKERQVILEELAMIEDNPAELAGILLDETVWPDQPLGCNVAGSAASVKQLTVASAEAYREAQYVPANMVVAVAGNIVTEKIVDQIEKLFGKLKSRKAGPWHPVQRRRDRARVALRNKATEQAHLCLAFPGVSLDDSRRFGMDLVSTLLGEGMSSRLFIELREERALVYDVHSYLSEYRDDGTLTVYAGCDPQNARTAFEAILSEVCRFSESLTDAELRKGKEMVKGRIQLRLEDSRTIAGWIGSQELLLDNILSVDEVLKRIHDVTLDDVRTLGETLLRRDRATLAVVGPFNDLSPFQSLL